MKDLELEYCGATGFRSLLKAIACIQDQPTLVFDEGGLRVLAMDPSHVTMVDFRLPAEAFDRYECVEPVRVGVALDELIGLMKRVKKNEEVRLSYSDGDKAIVLSLRDEITRVKKVPALEPLDDEVPEPKILYYAYARVLSGAIQRLVLPDAKDVSVHLCVEIGPDDEGVETLRFSATGDKGSVSVSYPRDHDQVLELRRQREAEKTTYTLRYLIEIFKGFKDLSEVVGFHLTTDMPLKIEAEIPQGQLVYYLAPCIGV